MKSKNICKFIPQSVDESLKISCFIFESNQEIINTPKDLTCHRAMLITSGEGEMLFGAQGESFAVGDMLFGFSGEKLSITPRAECELLYIEFAGNRADELFKRFCIGPHARRFSGFDGIIPLWRESLTRASESTIDLAAESMLLYALSRISADFSEQNCIVKKMIELSEENFNDNTLGLATLANELGYNSKYLSHTFKEKTGIGYSEYLRDLRIKYAVSLFDHGIDSVKNVALLSGFSDPLYFSTVFKNAVGLSPKEYLKNNTK